MNGIAAKVAFYDSVTFKVIEVFYFDNGHCMAM